MVYIYSCTQPRSRRVNMGKGFYISKAVAAVALVLGAGAVATIIALSVVYSQEKTKLADITPTAPTTTTPPTSVTTPLATTPSPSNEPWDQYRLPKTLVPDHYNVSLHPRLIPDSAGLYIFTGKSLVVFTCVEETDLILIHSNKLTYTQVGDQLATLSAVGGSVAPTIESSRLQTTTQYLVLQLSGKLTKGVSYQLDTVFQGELADDLGGLYRSEYNEDGVRK